MPVRSHPSALRGDLPRVVALSISKIISTIWQTGRHHARISTALIWQTAPPFSKILSNSAKRHLPGQNLCSVNLVTSATRIWSGTLTQQIVDGVDAGRVDAAAGPEAAHAGIIPLHHK